MIAIFVVYFKDERNCRAGCGDRQNHNAQKCRKERTSGKSQQVAEISVRETQERKIYRPDQEQNRRIENQVSFLFFLDTGNA